MDFLSKLKKYIPGNSDRTFRQQVQQEKRKKYLFSDVQNEKFESKRNTKGWLKKKKKHRPSSFTNIVSHNYNSAKQFLRDSTVLFSLGGILLALSGYIIFFSPYFHISPSHVIIESENAGVDINLAYRSIEDIYGKSIFLLDEESVGMTLKKSLKNIAHLSINKLYPNGVKVLIRSSPLSYDATIFGVDKNWYMTENGVLIPKSGNTSPTVSGEESLTELYPKIEIVSESLRNEVFFSYKQVIDDIRMMLISKIREIFDSEWKNTSITEMKYFSSEDEFHITLEGGTIIIFTLESINGDNSDQNRLDTIRNELIGLKTYTDKYPNALTDSTIAYIDARAIYKLFICKPRDICQNNLINIYGNSYKSE